MNRFTALGTSLGLGLVFFLSACSSQTPEEVESRIAASPKLRKIDSICSELPKPLSFQQIKKEISGNAGQSSIEYRYVSDQPFSSVREFYLHLPADSEYTVTGGNYTEPEGLLSNIYLARNGVWIVIEHRSSSAMSAIYNIGCIK